MNNKTLPKQNFKVVVKDIYKPLQEEPKLVKLGDGENTVTVDLLVIKTRMPSWCSMNLMSYTKESLMKKSSISTEVVQQHLY